MEDPLDSDLIENDRSEVEYAGFWVRVLAALIDALIFVIPLVIVTVLLSGISSLFVLTPFLYLILLVYKPFMEYRFGFTLGKKVVKIEVVRSDLQKLNLSRTLLRNLPWLLSQLGPLFVAILNNASVFLYDQPQTAARLLYIFSLVSQAISLFFVISAITVAFTKRKQGFHDMFAGALCIYTNSTRIPADQVTKVSQEDLDKEKARYAQRYRSLGPEELKAIVDDKRYTEAARLAAAELLRARS